MFRGTVDTEEMKEDSRLSRVAMPFYDDAGRPMHLDEEVQNGQSVLVHKGFLDHLEKDDCGIQILRRILGALDKDEEISEILLTGHSLGQ